MQDGILERQDPAGDACGQRRQMSGRQPQRPAAAISDNAYIHLYFKIHNENMRMNACFNLYPTIFINPWNPAG
jgi:hypothetical protein